MNVDVNKYAEHYFNFKNAGFFLVASFIGLFIVMALIMISAKIADRGKKKNDDFEDMDEEGRGSAAVQLIESFYELVFSGTSILFFIAAYYLIDRFLVVGRDIWEKYDDILLMVFIIFSVVLNSMLDGLVRLKDLKDSQKVSIRLVSTIYIMLIFAYIKFIYQDDNYDNLIVYFLGLVIGRFIYFDFTWSDFAKTIGGIVRNLPLLMLILVYTAFMCWYGFRSGFLLTSNGVVVSIFIAHLFMDFSIIVLHQTRIMKKLVKK